MKRGFLVGFALLFIFATSKGIALPERSDQLFPLLALEHLIASGTATDESAGDKDRPSSPCAPKKKKRKSPCAVGG